MFVVCVVVDMFQREKQKSGTCTSRFSGTLFLFRLSLVFGVFLVIADDGFLLPDR